nr:serine/threonine-protein kinase shk2 [Quercus suber]
MHHLASGFRPDHQMSGRPPTPTPSSAAPRSATEEHVKDRIPAYLPSLIDLVYAYGSDKADLESRLPSTFLESASVDGARFLGAGASFTASVRALPEGPRTLSTTTSLDGLIVTATKPAPQRPKFVVFKVANVGFDSRGYPFPQYKAALQSVLTEFHALLYPPLLEHHNIVNVLGLAWGTNPFNPMHRLPALVLEFADQGTLTEVLKRGQASNPEKRRLCFDVASGLQALHDAGLVHGDIKTDNVLCFASSGRRVAKLADFGFSVLADSGDTEVWLGGTKPWQAPEIQHAIPTAEAKYTDVYSFGLLVWSTALGGDDMFRRFCTSDQPAEKWDQEVEEFKTTTLMKQLSHTSMWIPIHYAKMIESNPDNPQVIDVVEASARLSPELSRSALQETSTAFAAKDEFLGIIDQVLSTTLDVKPSRRNLGIALEVLRPDLSHKMLPPSSKESSPRLMQQTYIDTPNHDRVDQAGMSRRAEKATTFHKSLPSWSSRGFKIMRDTAPALQCVIFNAYAQRETAGDDAAGLFLLCSFLVNGYGHPVDGEHACRVLRQSAALGNPHARAYLYRLHICLGISSVPGEDITQYLKDYGLHGFRAARNGYGSVISNEDNWNHIKLFMDGWGGVGADWYSANRMLHGLTQSKWIKDDFLISQAATISNVTEYKVNERGDSLLHFAAACGRDRSVRVLLDEYSFDVNMRNSAGDTPLICACRSGHLEATVILLDIYHADAGLSADNGETALHWLCGMISYFNYSILKLAQLMIANGANIEAKTTKRVCHGYFQGTIDTDFQMPGTALDWAVHDNRAHVVKALLDLGAEAHNVNDPHEMSPLAWAAHFHHHECLKFIIEALEERHEKQQLSNARQPGLGHDIMYAPLHRRAIHAADRFSMILRTGVNYLGNLKKTLDLLREKAKLISLPMQFGGHNQTLFYYAVMEAHDDVVGYMLEHDWHTNDINTPCGELLRTPVLEAVRWCRLPLVELLVKNGADIRAKGANPYYPEVRNWSALHILAHEGHDTDPERVVKGLLSLGVDIEGDSSYSSTIAHGSTKQGYSEPSSSTVESQTIDSSRDLNLLETLAETPLSCALRSNAFKLCNALIKYQASTTALRKSSGLHKVTHVTTILGHMIVSNARYSLPRIRYLFDQHPKDLDTLFIVEPERKISALHRAAMANDGVYTTFGTLVERSEFDMTTNHEILGELLKYFSDANSVNARCKLEGKTALMLALNLHNLGAAQLLVHAGADITITDDNGSSASDYAKVVADSLGSQIDADWQQLLAHFSISSAVNQSQVDGAGPRKAGKGHVRRFWAHTVKTLQRFTIS